MANSFVYKNTIIKTGDSIKVSYKIIEGEKSRLQDFAGFLIGVKGGKENEKMITVRKISRSGIGVERIFPLSSPLIANITLKKKSNYQKAKAYFTRGLSLKQLRKKLYHKR